MQWHGWIIQSVSQGGCRSGLSKQKGLCDSAAPQCGQAEDFLCSSPILARKKEEKKFQQFVYVKYKLKWYEFIYLNIELLNSVIDKVVTNQPICKFSDDLQKSIFSNFFFLFESVQDGALEKLEAFFSSENQNWDFIMFH